MIHLTIDGKPVEVEKGTTILHAAREGRDYDSYSVLYRRSTAGRFLPFMCS